MRPIRRKYQDGDVSKISEFYGKLAKNNCQSNNLKCAWECFSKHPCFPEFHPEEFGVWENNGEVIGVVCLESPWNGAVFFDHFPQYQEICDEMIQYAEEHFAGTSKDGGKYLRTNVLSSNKRLQEALALRGYEKSPEAYANAYSLYDSIPNAPVPEGFTIKSLEEVYDFDKLNRLLWKAFDYEGEPPAYDSDVKLSIKHAWLEYRRDICSAVIAPDGSYASFCGMWFDEENQEVYLEPLATSKEYRNLGLAKACVYAALKSCKELGAIYAYVDPDEEAYDFYKKIGFVTKVREGSQWKRCF